MRESFIILQLTMFFTGLFYSSENREVQAFIFLSFGSYGLICTKPYLWVCLIIAMLIEVMVGSLSRRKEPKLKKLFISGLLVPLFAFAGTTSTYAINNIFEINVTEMGNVPETL